MPVELLRGFTTHSTYNGSRLRTNQSPLKLSPYLYVTEAKQAIETMAPATRAPAGGARARKAKPAPAPRAADLALKQKMMEMAPEMGGQGMLGPEESAWAQLLRQQHGKGSRELGLTDSVKTIEVRANMLL